MLGCSALDDGVVLQLCKNQLLRLRSKFANIDLWNNNAAKRAPEAFPKISLRWGVHDCNWRLCSSCGVLLVVVLCCVCVRVCVCVCV